MEPLAVAPGSPPISCNGSPMRSPSAIRRSTSARSTN